MKLLHKGPTVLRSLGGKCAFSTGDICMVEVRVRFAPSPTGYLHLGSLRTALHNFLFARANEGKFILRIEDTDRKRLVPGTVEKMVETLNAVGLAPDEGPVLGGSHGPYIQSERIDIYEEYANKLIDSGHAYRCFCSRRRLEMIRKNAVKNGETPKYDNRCRRLTEEQIAEKLGKGLEYCLRVILDSTPEPFNDLVYGPISHDVSELEGDPIIMKSDGFPTYHFANVVDDHLMNISHVLRGVEWQISTNKHLLLYKAFGWRPPLYAHLPLIINSDGTKLSKRQDDLHLSTLLDSGVYPEALTSFIAEVGGGFPELQHGQFHPISQLINTFALETVNTNSGRLEMEKLDRHNQLFLQRQMTDDVGRQQIVNQVMALLQHRFCDQASSGLQQRLLEPGYVGKAVDWAISQGRISRLPELVGRDLSYLWAAPQSVTAHQIATVDIDIKHSALLGSCVEKLERVSADQFNKECLVPTLKSMTQEMTVNFRAFMRILRLAISGLEEGPGVAEMMQVLGKANSLERLQHTRQLLQSEAR